MESILGEQRLGLSGLVDQPVEIGRLPGATHLLQVSLDTAPSTSMPRGFVETISRRLIDVESGKVAASVLVETW